MGKVKKVDPVVRLRKAAIDFGKHVDEDPSDPHDRAGMRRDKELLAAAKAYVVGGLESDLLDALEDQDCWLWAPEYAEDRRLLVAHIVRFLKQQVRRKAR